MNIKCSLWDKDDDIYHCIRKAHSIFTEERKDMDDKTVMFDDVYKCYLKMKNREKDMIVNKGYFERFVDHKLKDYILYPRVISEKWLETTYSVLDEI